jgi:hypothetical protein
VRRVLRRIDDVVAGEPVEIGHRVLTLRARHTGWVFATPYGSVYRISSRPQSLSISEGEGGPAVVVPVPDRQRQLTLALWFVAVVLIARVWRRSR